MSPLEFTCTPRKSALKVLHGMALVAGLAFGPCSYTLVHAQGAVVRGLPDFTELVEQVGPSVVNIRTIERMRQSAGNSASPDEQMLEFFKRFGIPVPPGAQRNPKQDKAPQQDEERPTGVGSGFVLTPTASS